MEATRMKISAAKKADRAAFFTLSPEAYRLRRADLKRGAGHRKAVRLQDRIKKALELRKLHQIGRAHV